MKSPKSNNTPVMSLNKVHRDNSIKPARKEEINVTKTEEIKVEKNGHNNAPTSEIKLDDVKVEKKPTINFVAPPKLTSLVYCKDPIRDKMREILAEALCKVSEEADDESRDEVNAHDPYRVAVSVESAMFEKWGKSNGALKLKYRSVMFNVKDPKNPDFRRKILLGHVKPERIVELTAEEMASTERQMAIVKIKEKALFDCERGAPPKATTDQFRCGRCGKRKCTYYQLQTRSADEPMTTFVTCVNCDNHWKFC
uniref:Transcription elongation factor n=1 Tax=Tanacetum cinerariifolium TaxID=118510 RepID=A0A6L2JUJ2_TANCI|nr:transcription elongation factor TFIIS-like [Tanacetum cinerariifolium]